MHVVDVASALVALLSSDVSGAINIGCGEPSSLADLLLAAAMDIGREDLIRLGARPRAINDPDVLLPDITRQARELKWVPAFTVRGGIANTVAWWREITR